MKQYNVGDTVWLAEYNHTSVKKPCPICFAKKQVTLILGNGVTVLLPCDFCGKGYNEPTGVITEYEYVAKATPRIITKIASETDAIGEERKYYFGGCYVDIKDLFDTEEEALARCKEKINQRELEETTQTYNLKHNRLKSYAWNAGYHLAQARRHRKDAEYHDKKAILCEAKKRNSKKIVAHKEAQ